MFSRHWPLKPYMCGIFDISYQNKIKVIWSLMMNFCPILFTFEPIIWKLKRNSKIPHTVLEKNYHRWSVPNFTFVRCIHSSVNSFQDDQVAEKWKWRNKALKILSMEYGPMKHFPVTSLNLPISKSDHSREIIIKDIKFHSVHDMHGSKSSLIL